MTDETNDAQVLVHLKAKTGVTPAQIGPVMHDEILATVQLYLAGKIRQWYSRADNAGVVFILSSHDVIEAQAVMAGLPLTKEDLVDVEYIPLAPLKPLGILLGDTARSILPTG